MKPTEAAMHARANNNRKHTTLRSKGPTGRCFTGRIWRELSLWHMRRLLWPCARNRSQLRSSWRNNTTMFLFLSSFPLLVPPSGWTQPKSMGQKRLVDTFCRDQSCETQNRLEWGGEWDCRAWKDCSAHGVDPWPFPFFIHHKYMQRRNNNSGPAYMYFSSVWCSFTDHMFICLFISNIKLV